MATQYLDAPLRPYNARFKRKPKTQGNIAPVTKRRNPYVSPNPGGGSGPTTPATSQRQGVDAQTRALANKPPVSTTLDVNYESDPVLAKIKALGTKSVGDAEAEAEALRKQAVIDTGLADIGAEIGLDAATLQAARENPLSVAQRLTREGRLRGNELDESLNQQNLFWSGHRGTQLANLAQSQMEEQANLARDLRAALGGIDAGVLEARNAAALQEQDALGDAAARAQQAAMEQAFWDALAGTINTPTPPPEPFIDPALAELAMVDPYYYDPYEQDLALAMALNPIYGQPLAF